MRRPVVALLATVVVLLGEGMAPAASAPAPSRPMARAAAEPGAEAEFVDRVNSARAAAGKGSLSTDAELTSIARRWSQRMANEQRLSHNPNLANEVQADWEKLAENVGFGQNVGQIHDAFMNSAAHRNNILDGAFTHIGIGVVIDGAGQIWVTQVFMRLRGGGGGSAPPPTTAAPPPPPPTTTTARPAPAPTSPPTTRAPRVTTPTTARPAPAPTTPRVTTAPPPPDPAAEAASAAAAAAEAAAAAAATAAAEVAAAEAAAAAAAATRTPTPRLVLVLEGLAALDQGR